MLAEPHADSDHRQLSESDAAIETRATPGHTATPQHAPTATGGDDFNGGDEEEEGLGAMFAE